ncbi:hypothetical protein EI94DRAFT_1706169 [Lactarius quietus]|nr:hypothetical protein EI94DRAFT_1706169 [Lactarius quietus]
MTGISKLSDQVFLIDFGLAQLFCDPSTCWHISLVSGLKTTVYLCHGRLPWQDIIKEGPVEQYEEAIVEMKTTLATGLCQGLPSPFITFTQHIQSLTFDEKP